MSLEIAPHRISTKSATVPSGARWKFNHWPPKTDRRDQTTQREARVKRSDQRILTTHVGSLPRPDDLMALYAANAPDEKLQPRLRAAVGGIVRQQAESGIDVIND